MDLTIPETNKKQFNNLAETIINELAKSFPIGVDLHERLYDDHEELLRPTINYLLHADYLFRVDNGSYYYLTEKSVKSLNNRTGFPPIVP